MSFATSIRKKSGEFKKAVYMQLRPGNTYYIRILDKDAMPVLQHSINKMRVNCLGDGCPQCQVNRELYLAHPKDGNKQPGYASIVERFYTNVLDLTPYKICPQCGVENSKKSSVCYACETLIPVDTPATPSNKVKVIDKGNDFYNQINGVQDYLNGLEDVPLKTLNDVVIVVSVSGEQKRPSYSAIPKTDVEPLPEGLELYDLEKLPITFTREEMIDLMGGKLAKDIFAMRRVTDAISDITAEEEIAKTIGRDASQIISELFPN